MAQPNYSYKTIKVATSGPVAVVTLSRPEARNAWIKESWVELIDIYSKLENDAKIRVIVMTGDPASPVFCAGADLNRGQFMDDSRTETEARDPGGRFALTVYRSRKITIAAINGSASGIGITQTLPMDLRFAWQDAKIVFPFVRRGIVPEATSSYFLPRLIGQSRAFAVLIQGSQFSASSSLLSGLFAHLLPTKEEVLPHALRVAHELASNVSPASVAYTKSLIFHAKDTPEEQHLLDSRAVYVLDRDHDREEGVGSFLQKRKPVFQNFATSDLPKWLSHSSDKNGENSESTLGYRKSKL